MPPKRTESGTLYAVVKMPDGRCGYSTVSEIGTMPDFTTTLIEEESLIKIIKRWTVKWVKLTHQVLRVLRK